MVQRFAVFIDIALLLTHPPSRWHVSKKWYGRIEGHDLISSSTKQRLCGCRVLKQESRPFVSRQSVVTEDLFTGMEPFRIPGRLFLLQRAWL